MRLVDLTAEHVEEKTAKKARKLSNPAVVVVFIEKNLLRSIGRHSRSLLSVSSLWVRSSTAR